MRIDYNLMIGTHDTKSAGTDANVFIRLIYQDPTNLQAPATFGQSIAVPGLHEQNTNMQTGLPISDELPAGCELTGIVVGHDNSGNKPGWDVSTIVLLTTAPRQTSYTLAFRAANWIAADEPGSVVDRSPDGAIDAVERTFWFKVNGVVVAKSSRTNPG